MFCLGIRQANHLSVSALRPARLSSRFDQLFPNLFGVGLHRAHLSPPKNKTEQITLFFYIIYFQHKGWAAKSCFALASAKQTTSSVSALCPARLSSRFDQLPPNLFGVGLHRAHLSPPKYLTEQITLSFFCFCS